MSETTLTLEDGVSPARDLATYCAATERMFIVLANIVHAGPVWTSSEQVPMFFVLASDAGEAERKGRAVLMDVRKAPDGCTVTAHVSVSDEF